MNQKRYLLVIFILFFLPLTVRCQEIPEGMKTYTFVMLKKGPDRNQDKATVEKIQSAHLAHMAKMAEENNLNLAGPFLDDGFWRGILVFDSSDTAAVRRLIEMDPAVKAGRLTYEIHPWMTKQGSSLK